MAELIQSKGKQIEDHSLEILDLPLAREKDSFLIAGVDLIYQDRAIILDTEGAFMLDDDGEFITL